MFLKLGPEKLQLYSFAIAKSVAANVVSLK